MDGEPIYLRASIRSKNATEGVHFSWIFRRVGDGQTFGSGDGIALPNKTIPVASKLILQPDKYTLEFRIGNAEARTVATIPVKERGEVTLQYVLPFIISLLTLVLSVGLSVIASILTTLIVGN